MSPDRKPRNPNDSEDPDLQTILHAAGYKIVIGRPGEDPPPPRAWREVPARVNAALMSIATGVFELIADVIKSASRLARGLGNLPLAASRSLEARAARHLSLADERENREQLRPHVEQVEAAAARLRDFLVRKKVEGYTVIITTVDGVNVIAIVPPIDEQELARAIAESVRQLPDSDRDDRTA